MSRPARNTAHKPARTRKPRSVREIFLVPLLLALASLAGLVLGLTGEGVRDWMSWALLALPLLAVLLAAARTRRHRHD